MFNIEGKFKFEGHFPMKCQNDSVPYNLKLLLSMILNGLNVKNEENTIHSQNCPTISQLVQRKGKTLQKKNVRHSLDREPPLPSLPIYIYWSQYSFLPT